MAPSRLECRDGRPVAEPSQRRAPRPNEVSTYLHVGDNLAVTPVYESITLPFQKRASVSPAPSPSAPEPQTTNVTFYPTTGTNGGGGGSIFSSLKRMSKKRKRKRDVRRHTIQKIMGVDEQAMRRDRETIAYDTQTWPLKEARRKKSSERREDAVEGYVKNPLLTDIDSEGLGENSITPYAVSANQVKGHCRFLSLGSVLSFDLPKDMSRIPSIQDIITIAPPEARNSDVGAPSQRNTVLSSFRQTRLAPAKTGPPTSCSLVDNEDRSVSDIEINPDETSQPIYENQGPHKHKCLSVHTLIRDLNRCQNHQCKQEDSHQVQPSQASHLRVNLKSTMSVNIRQDSVDPGSFRLRSNPPSSDPLRPKGVVGRLVSLELGGTDRSKTRETDAMSREAADPVRLDHQQFEEEEEELEDIWNRTPSYRQSICSDIMYQHNREDPMVSDRTDEMLCCSSTTTRNQPVLYRNLLTASAPNLLMAEFKLSSHVQSDEDLLPPRAGGERRSWAAFPNREPSGPSSVVMNETASDPVKLPDVGDKPRYVYQYRKEEEEEEEELTSCLKDQSINLSVCLDQQNPEKQQEQTTTGGRCFILCGKPELQSMEGTLERKHKLQLGGKKAASRGWSSFHTVLHRHTLCFFQDRKDLLRSSACGLPLNLTGAECSPAPEYCKKPNCFRLRLRDGSEYLFNASSRFMMKKWIMKIQASTDQSDSVPSVQLDTDRHSALKPSVCLRCQDQSGCRCCSKHDVVNTFLRQKPQSLNQSKETCFSSREMQSGSTRLTEQPDVSSSAAGFRYDDDDDGSSFTHRLSGPLMSSSPPSSESDDPDPLSSKQRCHSFTSATYQRIKPALRSPGGRGLDRVSNYCVTLVVGDSLGLGAPPGPSPGWGHYSALRSCTSLPRPRNKSVFKKFFGRKDL